MYSEITLLEKNCIDGWNVLGIGEV